MFGEEMHRAMVSGYTGRTGWLAGLMILGAAQTCGAAGFRAIDLSQLPTPAGYDNVLHFDEHAAAAGHTVGYGYGTATGGAYHALLWPGSGAIDLNPTGFDQSWARAVNGGLQVGFGNGPATGGANHALIWNGTAQSAIDLHPGPLFSESYAYGLGSGQTVGSGSGVVTGNQEHALLWAGAAASSAVDLHPAMYGPLGQSFAYGVGDGQQIGHGYGPDTNFEFHATLWSGSAASAVDLNPAGFHESYGYGTSGGMQVGKGNNSPAAGNYHALLWSGTAASAVDLNPEGYTYSSAYGVGNGREIGSGYGPATDYQFHALAWTGSAASAVDLHSLLPAGFITSYAYSIDSSGNIWGLAQDSAGIHSIEWLALKLQSDFNGDGQVDVSDLGVLATHWQQAANFAGGDATGDGFVDVSDLGILATEWQQTIGGADLSSSLAAVGLSGASVPEPCLGGALILSASAVTLLRRRRSRA